MSALETRLARALSCALAPFGLRVLSRPVGAQLIITIGKGDRVTQADIVAGLEHLLKVERRNLDRDRASSDTVAQDFQDLGVLAPDVRPQIGGLVQSADAPFGQLSGDCVGFKSHVRLAALVAEVAGLVAGVADLISAERGDVCSRDLAALGRAGSSKSGGLK